MSIRFADRRSAGIALARALAPYRQSDAVVLGLPRGGLPVAAEVAAALDLPLGLVLVRKIGHPANPELAVAAIAGPEGRTLVLNEGLAASLGLDPARINDLARPQRAELARRKALWLGGDGGVSAAGRTAILVDDGIATGATMRAAIGAARAEGATHVVVAAPVAAADTVATLSGLADDLVCLDQPEPFVAVGLHYQSFPQVSDDEVRRLLEAAGSAPHAVVGGP